MADPIQGYFNSTTFTLDVNGFPIWNRAVGSEFMAKFAHTALGNGAADVTTGGFQVVKKTGMTVTVKPYFICKDGYMMYQTAETDITLNSSASEQVFYIGARLDVANNHFENDDVAAYTTFVSATDIASCKLTITANAVTITDGMIEDLRYNTTYCGQLDEFRERSLALLAELERALAVALAGGVPAHAVTHEVGGGDPIRFASNTFTLDKDNWSTADYTIAVADVAEIADITENTIIEVLPTANSTADERDAWRAALVVHGGQVAATSFTLTADGDVPAIDIPIQIIFGGEMA